MKWGILATLFIVFISGCNPSSLQKDSYDNNVNSIPRTFENPDAQSPLDLDQKPPLDKPEQPLATAPAQSSGDNQVAQQTTTPSVEKPSELIKNAQKIMEKEGKRIGTACNLYIRRVLVVSGFAEGFFMANDFDIYAKKSIPHYKTVEFKRDPNGTDKERLQKHIWSYPERTPFILQWKTNAAHGHIALLERIGEKLIIYQASLGRFTARKDQTTIQILLSGYNRRTLTVYSEMTPK